MNLLSITTSLLLACVAAVTVGAQTPPYKLRPVAGIDLDRYAGRWYEIAKYPNRFQKQCVGNTTANYSLKSNGRLEVINECLKKDGTPDRAVGEAKIADKNNNAKLKVRFAPSILSLLPFVWGDYWVVEIADDYSYSVIGEPKREYFWILARKPEMDAATFQAILRRAESMGFKPGRVEKTPQKVEVLKGAVTIKD